MSGAQSLVYTWVKHIGKTPKIAAFVKMRNLKYILLHDKTYSLKCPTLIRDSDIFDG